MDDKTIIINVGRQLGSGGCTIARNLATTFGFQFYDREILNLAAKESGFSEEFFKQNDEQKGFLKSLFHLHAPLVSDNNFYDSRFSQESLFQFQSDAIRKAARQGSCVFVGRCADYILRDFPHVLNIFVTADLAERVRMVSRRNNCAEEEAMKIIQNVESTRSAYYNYYTGKKWGAAASYDICVNTTLLGIDATEKMLESYIREFIMRCAK